MKPDQNDPCYCGSGKKFKHCHLSQEKTQNLLKQGRIKECLHPQRSECHGPVIQAHSIQNNRILSAISRVGKVYMITGDVKATSFKTVMILKGRQAASTFTGFCSYHDTNTFKPIELREYQSDDLEQNALFAYRSFAFDFHKKREAYKVTENMDQRHPLVHYIRKGHEASLRWMRYYKSVFDEMLTSNKFDVIETVTLQFSGAAQLAACSCFFLEYDLKGKKLNDVVLFHQDDQRRRLLMLNVFPQGNKTIVLMSWLAEDIEFYKGFKNQFLSLSSNRQLVVVNNILLNYSENVTIGPDLWDHKLSQEQRDKYVYEFGFKSSPREDVLKKTLVKDRGYSLFLDIK